MNENNSPLHGLVEDETRISLRIEKELFDLLKPYVFIGEKNKEIGFREKAHDLPIRLMLILFFLGRLATEQLGFNSDRSISQKEAIDFFRPNGIPAGTIKPNFKRLRDEKIISNDSSMKGRYLIGFDKISKIKKEFKKYEQS